MLSPWFCLSVVGFPFLLALPRVCLAFIHLFFCSVVGHNSTMKWATMVHKSDLVFALTEIVSRWQGENINKNLLQIAISALKKRHQINQIGARLD